MESFPYVIRYKQSKKNIVSDVLSRKYALLNTLSARLFGFKYVKDLYASDVDLCDLYENTIRVHVRNSIRKRVICLMAVGYASYPVL